MKPRLLVVLGVAAVILVFLMPPFGFVLGIYTVVQATRAVRATRPRPEELLTPAGVPVTVHVPQPGRTNAIFALCFGAVATVIGTLLLLVLIVFWTEINDFADCQSQTNTTQGLENCQTQLKDAIFDRVGQ